MSPKASSQKMAVVQRQVWQSHGKLRELGISSHFFSQALLWVFRLAVAGVANTLPRKVRSENRWVNSLLFPMPGEVNSGERMIWKVSLYQVSLVKIFLPQEKHVHVCLHIIHGCSSDSQGLMGLSPMSALENLAGWIPELSRLFFEFIFTFLLLHSEVRWWGDSYCTSVRSFWDFCSTSDEWTVKAIMGEDWDVISLSLDGTRLLKG